MFFTQEDYRKIEKWLTANSRKDTDFVGATTPLKGNETVVLVQDGKNVKTSVKDIVDQFFLLGVSDFLNITDKYGESYISLTQAIQLIPFRSRKIGQVITFIDESGNWAIYQFQGKALNQWNNTTLWIDLLAKISGIPIIGSEDIITKVDDAKQVSLYLADKHYNEADYSGLGRIYLRKNIQTVIDPSTGAVINVNLLTQSMLAKENTIYIIQYDYNLNKQTISIPEGCILDMRGGSVTNGTINCVDTIIISTDDSKLDVTLTGTYRFDSEKLVTLNTEDINISQSVDRKNLTISAMLANRDTTNGMGYVILRKDKSFKEQVTQENTIYEIRYDFDLNGAEITIPEGCVLDFQGGSLNNGKIVFSNTYLEGNVIIKTNICGEIKNDIIYLSWFNNNELLSKIKELIGDYNVNTHTGVTYNNGKTFIVPNKTYILTKGLELFGVHDICIDFNGATLIDTISDEYLQLYNTHPGITIIDSYNIEIKNINYKYSESKVLHLGTTGFIWIGERDRITYDCPIYNIKIHDINGESYKYPPSANKDTGFVFVCALGEMYNLELYNIKWKGCVSTLCNFEYGLKDDANNNYMGARPYNCYVYNIYAEDIHDEYNTAVVLRTGSGYNLFYNNIHTINCDIAFELYNGDEGISKAIQTIVINNSTNINSNANSKFIAITIGFHNGTSNTPHYEHIIYTPSITLENCTNFSSGRGIVYDGGLGGLSIKRCYFKGCEEVFSINTARLSDASVSIDDCVIDSCNWGLFFTNVPFIVNNCSFNNIKNCAITIICNYSSDSIHEILSNGGIFNSVFSNNELNRHYIEVRSDVNTIYRGIKVQNNIFKNADIVPAASYPSNIRIDFNNNIGKIKLNLPDNYKEDLNTIESSTIDGNKSLEWVKAYGGDQRISHVLLENDNDEIVIYKNSLGSIIIDTTLETNNSNAIPIKLPNEATVHSIIGTAIIRIYRTYPYSTFASISVETLNVNVSGERALNSNIGDSYFDTTLNKPKWWTGSAWVDATGATV